MTRFYKLKKIIVLLLVLGIIGGLKGGNKETFLAFYPPQKAYASPGVRTKTVEFYIGQNFSTSGIGSGTTATYDFTVYLPDAITSASVIRSAYIEYNTVISAVNASATTFQLGVVGNLVTLSSPQVISQSGESQPVQMKLSATSPLQSLIQGPGTYNLRFTTSITGPVRYGENAKLVLTYDYDDSATTQIKTITAWVHSQTATVASGATVTSSAFNLGLPEASITTQSAFIEAHGYVNAALTTGFYWNSETRRDIAWINTANSYDFVALVAPQTTYNPNTNNTFSIVSVSGAFSAPSAVLHYTYSFNYANSNELMNSLSFLLYQGTETASTATLSGSVVINLPESGIVMKSCFLKGRAVNTNTSAMTLGINAQLGSVPSTTGINFLANAAETDGFRTIIWNVTSNLASMTGGNNTVYWAYSASAATNIRGLVLYLNYKYNKANTTTFNCQAEFHVGQQTAASTTWSQSFTPSIADSNYTLKASYLSAQYNSNSTTAVTYTVGIGTTSAYAFLSTGENTMGEVWRDTSSNVSSLGSSLTVTLNTNVSTTKSASFLVLWQTSLANFEQKQENWRFYNDAVNVIPADSNALAGENVAPSEVTETMVLRLRISIKETGGADQKSASVRKLQWSTSPDFSVVYDVDSQGGTGIWRYYDGPATDGANVSPPYKLTSAPAPTTGGKYCESNNPTYALSANQVAEFEYTIKGYNLPANQTYYFRLWDDSAGAAIPLDSGKSYPSLTTAFQGDLTLSNIAVTWSNVNPDNPPDNTGKGLTCTVTANGGWQVKVDSSSGDSQGRLWSAANSMAYDGTFTYTSSGSSGPNYQTTPTSFTPAPGTNVANWTSPVNGWQINVFYNLGTPTWRTLKGSYTATHTYTLTPI